MYVKRHAVVRDGKRYVYLRLVEAYRDESGRVRHRVCCARWAARTSSRRRANWSSWAASFARLDPPPAGTRRHVGPLLLVAHYVDRLGLVGLVDEAVPMRGRAMLTHGEVIAALAAKRPLRAGAALRRHRVGVQRGGGRIVRRPSGIAQRRPARPGAGGAGPGGRAGARASWRWPPRSRCGADLSRLHLDMTAVRFTGGYQGSALVAKGWAADRTIARQVKTLQASTRTGVAVYYRGHPGASNEAPCLAAALGPHPRAGPARGHLCRRLRLRLPGPAVRRRCRRAAVRGAATRRHRLGPVVRRRHRRLASTRWPHSTTAPNANDGLPADQRTLLEGRAGRPGGLRRRHRPAPTGCASPTSGPPKKAAMLKLSEPA